MQIEDSQCRIFNPGLADLPALFAHGSEIKEQSTPLIFNLQAEHLCNPKTLHTKHSDLCSNIPNNAPRLCKGETHANTNATLLDCKRAQSLSNSLRMSLDYMPMVPHCRVGREVSTQHARSFFAWNVLLSCVQSCLNIHIYIYIIYIYIYIYTYIYIYVYNVHTYPDTLAPPAWNPPEGPFNSGPHLAPLAWGFSIRQDAMARPIPSPSEK